MSAPEEQPGERALALSMALGSHAPERWGGKPPIATCPTCGNPLIGTFVFKYKEFVCLVCCDTWGFVEPVPMVETPELRARHDELQAEWEARPAATPEGTRLWLELLRKSKL